jgi:RNA polymerase sigma-70 factor, ECF subfamily
MSIPDSLHSDSNSDPESNTVKPESGVSSEQLSNGFVSESSKTELLDLIRNSALLARGHLINGLDLRDHDPDTAESELVLARQAYADFYRYSYPLVGRFVTSRIVSIQQPDLDIILSEVYLRAYKGLPRFRGASHPLTWVNTIAQRETMRLLEARSLKARKETPLSVLIDLGFEPVDGAVNTEQRIIDSTEFSVLKQALSELSLSDRNTILEFLVHDSHDGLAKALGVSVSAAKVRLHRARRRLKDIMGANNEIGDDL